MIRDTERVRVEAIDWRSAFPLLHIFRSCRMALGPSKMLLALALVVVAYLAGRAFDVVAGRSVSPDEIAQYQQLPAAEFEEYLENSDERLANALRATFAAQMTDTQAFDEAMKDDDRFDLVRDMINSRIDAERDAAMNDNLTDDKTKKTQRVGFERQRRILIAQLESLRPRGVFAAAFEHKMSAMRRMAGAAAAGDFGFGDWLARGRPAPNTVAGGLRDLCIVTPGWLWRAHPVFLIYFSIVAIALWSFCGGAISRLAAIHATRDERMPLATAVDFTISRYVWFVLSPLLPLIIVGVLALLLVIGGFVFFNVGVLDILGGLLYFLALIIGFIIAAVCLLVALSWPLLYPALAVEGTDAFDAIARAFGYVIGRPWRWLGYTLTAVAFGAFAVTLAALFVGGAIEVTHKIVGVGVFTSAAPGVDRFDAIAARDPNLGWSSGTSSWLVGMWVRLAWGLVAAYGVSFLMCSQTWVYLLLRKSADGTDVRDVYIDDRETRKAIEAPDSEPATAAPNTASPATASSAADANTPPSAQGDASASEAPPA